MPVANCETLENAVNRAAGDSRAGDTVLLSPACASFDQFRDFEDRGDRFKDLVGALK
jgi:UDP-N-acetylmuramoylalanine--D-glutamate ligase